MLTATLTRKIFSHHLYAGVGLLAALLINRFWLIGKMAGHVFRGVPNFYTWITLWNCHALETLNFHGYWASNAMYPYPHAFAFSENMIGVTPFTAPLWWLTGNPILTANLLSLLLAWLSGFAVYWIVSRLTRAFWPAVAAALIFMLYPMTMKAFSLGRIHMLALFTLPLVLYFNKRFWEDGGRGAGWLLMGTWLWTFLMNIYLGIFTAVFLGIWNFSWFWAERNRFPLKKILRWCVLAVVVWAVMVPIFIPYAQASRDIGSIRTLDNQMQYTGPIWSWFNVSDENWLWGQAFSFLPRGTWPRDGILEDYLFPGFLVLGLFFVSFFIRSFPPWLRALRLTGLVLFLVSLGPYTQGIPWKIPLPFNLLWWLFPPMRATRNPHRFAVFVILIAAVLIAYMLRNFSRRYRSGVLFFILILAVIMAETVTVATAEPAMRGNVSRFYAQLKDGDPSHLVMELPAGIQTDIRAMVASAYHWFPIVNGVSSMWPPLQSQLASDLSGFPSDDSIRLLQSLGVDRLVVHENMYGKRRRRLVRDLDADSRLQLIARDGWLSLWSLEGASTYEPLTPDLDFRVSGPQQSRAGDIRLSLDVSRARVGGYVFNRKAPSRFSFSPSLPWQIEVRDGAGRLLFHEAEWRAPAMFHPLNARKKLLLTLGPGKHDLRFLVDMMGETHTWNQQLRVIGGKGRAQDRVLPLPRLSRETRTNRDADLRMGLKWQPLGTLYRSSGTLYGILEVNNPGPYYWKAGGKTGVQVGIRRRGDTSDAQLVSLPHDLSPGDTVQIPLRINLRGWMPGETLRVNGTGKDHRGVRRWFPGDNEILVAVQPGHG